MHSDNTQVSSPITQAACKLRCSAKSIIGWRLGLAAAILTAAMPVLCCAEGDAAMEPVPADVKTPRAGGNALGCVASLLAVLRLMYGTYTEAPAAPAAAGAGPGPAAAGAAGGGAGGTGAPVRLVQSAPGVNHVTDYRLAVQMWLPRESNHNSRWGWRWMRTLCLELIAHETIHPLQVNEICSVAVMGLH